MASTVDMRSGLRAVGALRSDEERGQEPVALETPVLATGARPGDAAARRELFTEETQTVLVFENGAVIRLSAAVADGQLLFLTNKKTGKEVVAQVIRKRSFRPTSCYVDLEFTEPCPSFWGIEFPKSAATSPASAQLTEPEGDQPPVPAPAAPTQHEVERLKNEVANLQSKLKSLTNTAQAAEITRESSAVTELAAAAPSETQLTESLARHQEEQSALEQLFAQEAQQEQLNGPKRLVGYTKKGSASAMVKKAGKVALAGAFAAVIASAGVAAYRFGLLDSIMGKNSSAKVAAREPVPAAPRPANTATPTPASIAVSNPSATSSSSLATPSGISEPAEAKPPAPEITANAVTVRPAQPTLVPEKSWVLNSERPTNAAPPKKAVPASSSREINRTSPHPAIAGLTRISAAPSGAANNGFPASTSEGASAGEVVTPKLLHAVKPVAPSDALRNYVTGDVVVDALVDATGHVKSVTVISGPEKLRNTAIEEMKQYVYEPAKKDGKAIQWHVQASLQFWYEP